MGRRLSLAILIAARLFGQTPLQTCTVTNNRGVPVQGTFCGGAASSLTCSPGALYDCKQGAAGTKNNCTLKQACATACLQGASSGSCVNVTAPFTVTPNSTSGGTDIGLNVNLAATHHGAIINLKIDRGDIVPGAFCAVPSLPDNQNSVNFALSTAVVPAPTPVRLYTDVAYIDAQGVSSQLISTPQTLTLNPGGTEPPPPPIATYTLDPTSIAAGGIGFARVSLASKAPASGVQITLGSSNPSVASIIANGQPFVLGSCTDAQVAESIQAASSVPQTTVVDISASSGAAGQASLVQPLTVTAGCVPVACSGGPSCGPQPNGCGGTINCGCSDPNQTCGGGGVANQCGSPVLTVTSLSMSPTTVTAGNSSIGTITISPPAPSTGAVVALSSNSSAVSVPASITLTSGANTASFSAATTSVQASVAATISATLNGTVTAPLNVTASPTCAPTTCAALGKTCGTAPDGCGGTLTCGSACASSNATITVSVTGKGGKVTSNPAGLNVSSGGSGSASFATGTQVSLTTDNGHGAIWSGLCSSGGVPSISCAFTVNASGTITATEQ